MKRKSLPTGRDFLFVEGYGNENPGAFQSPRPLRGVTCIRGEIAAAINISIHAPLAGRDQKGGKRIEQAKKISTLAPLAGRDRTNIEKTAAKIIFQPTRPLRGATTGTEQVKDRFEISTHAPLAGRDNRIYAPSQCVRYFNPRAPCGARRAANSKKTMTKSISTHAPLAGRDQ